MAFPVEGHGWAHSAAVAVSQTADGVVHGEVHGVDGDAAETAWRTAQAVLSLDFDGSGYEDVARRDPVAGRVLTANDFMRPVCFHSPYEAACSFVIGHRISIAQTRAIRDRLAREHGDRLSVDGSEAYAFPRPQVLLELSSYGPISGEKMERLHGIAHAALQGRLDRERLRSMPYEAALDDVRNLRGVGDFTAQGIILRGAGVADEVPGDEVTALAVQQVYGLPSVPDRETMLRIAEPWRPYRMWVSVALHFDLRSSGRPSRSTLRPRRPRSPTR